jgi:hypothetical protein
MGYRLTMSGPFRAQLFHHAILRLAARSTIPGFAIYQLKASLPKRSRRRSEESEHGNLVAHPISSKRHSASPVRGRPEAGMPARFAVGTTVHRQRGSE